MGCDHQPGFAWLGRHRHRGLDHYVVVSGLATGGERSTATVTATRNDSMPGSAQISGRSILGSLTPSFGDATRLAQSFKFEILNYDDDYTWRASATKAHR